MLKLEPCTQPEPTLEQFHILAQVFARVMEMGSDSQQP